MSGGFGANSTQGGLAPGPHLAAALKEIDELKQRNAQLESQLQHLMQGQGVMSAEEFHPQELPSDANDGRRILDEAQQHGHYHLPVTVAAAMKVVKEADGNSSYYNTRTFNVHYVDIQGLQQSQKGVDCFDLGGLLSR